ncbi:MAG: Gfo/Idh/MocA family oxidoreductase [Planctomycetota bacterium]
MLKVACIGTGGIIGAHMPGWEKSPDAEVVAGVDPNAEHLKAWGEKHGINRLHERVEDVLSDPEVDIVDICTPNRFHAPLTVQALEAGKHVLCEKPLVPTVAEVRQIIDARDKADRLVMTAQNFRFLDKSVALKHLVDAGRLGEVYHSRAWWLRRGAIPTRPGFLLMEQAGGGPCIDLGVHVLDLTLHLLGHPKPVSVTGTAVTKLANKPGAWSEWGGKLEDPAAVDVEEFAAGMVRFDNGSTLVLETSWMLHHPTRGNGDVAIWLYGDKAGAYFGDDSDVKILETDNDANHFRDTIVRPMDTHLGGHAVECIAFAKAVREGAPSPVPPEDSLAVIGVLDGLYQSSRAGREVPVVL